MREEENTGIARKLRRSMTEMERVLWYRLRDRRLNGAKFRRQVPIGKYVADFVCMDAMLVVELDGGQHATRLEADRARDAFIASQGFTVLRFWNNEVKDNLDSVLMTIMRRLQSPHPNLLPQAGEGTSPLVPGEHVVVRPEHTIKNRDVSAAKQVAKNRDAAPSTACGRGQDFLNEPEANLGNPGEGIFVAKGEGIMSHDKMMGAFA